MTARSPAVREAARCALRRCALVKCTAVAGKRSSSGSGGAGAASSKKASMATATAAAAASSGENFRDYADFERRLSEVSSHAWLAMHRGVELKLLRLSVAPRDEASVAAAIARACPPLCSYRARPGSGHRMCLALAEGAAAEAWGRLLKAISFARGPAARARGGAVRGDRVLRRQPFAAAARAPAARHGGAWRRPRLRTRPQARGGLRGHCLRYRPRHRQAAATAPWQRQQRRWGWWLPRLWRTRRSGVGRGGPRDCRAVRQPWCGSCRGGRRPEQP
mmetsp:Transcript_22981/g.72202  ORF Transcript_22981/g.72202 Transcript_22981/m.72202 type:complete len:277 (+) Transcript_22981:670-1500(+)